VSYIIILVSYLTNNEAIHLAAGEGHVEVVKLLLDAGADMNVRDRWGNRPLDEAINGGHSDVVEMLKSNGAKAGSGSSAGTMEHEAILDLMHTYGQVRDGVLCMDWHDVKKLLKGIGEEPTDEVVQKMFDVADLDGNGYIDTDEFLDNHEIFLGERPARIILLVGGPGSGKGLLSERLVKECGVVHISSGELLREEVAKGTPLGRQVEGIMKSGGLVSSAIMVALMQKRMKDHPGKRILLDGFPRSRENAEGKCSYDRQSLFMLPASSQCSLPFPFFCSRSRCTLWSS
jgi:Adenylate kinase/Ankyrin repeats (many copies)/EF hand